MEKSFGIKLADNNGNSMNIKSMLAKSYFLFCKHIMQQSDSVLSLELFQKL